MVEGLPKRWGHRRYKNREGKTDVPLASDTEASGRSQLSSRLLSATLPPHTNEKGAHFDPRVKAILLDLDGTIGNTLPLCITAFRESIEPMVGRTVTDDEIVATFGPSEEGTIAVLLPEQRAEGLDSYLRRYEELHCRWPSPFEGIPEILSYLKTKRIFVGLVTGKGETKYRAHAKTLWTGRLFRCHQDGSLLVAGKGPEDRRGNRGVLAGPRRSIVRGGCSQ